VFALSNAPSVPFDVTPGAEVTVPIRYRPLVVGSVTGALRILSNAEAMPQVTVALSGTGVPVPVPEIEVSRSSISFGAVQVGGPGGSAVTVTQSVQIRNAGSVNLRLMALGVESARGTEFALGSAPALPVDLTPQAAVNVEVEYQPETIGTVTGALYIRSNADNVSDVTVALNGTGVSVPMSQIIASTPVLAFGEMQVGSERMLEVSLTNTGSANLTLLTAAVSGNAAFTLQQAPTFPVTVSPNASVALHVQYQPNATGTVTGVLSIESDAANTPNLTVPLSGTGASVSMPLSDVNPLDIAFAEVEVGGGRIVPVTITNAGTADLRVNDLILTTSTGTDFSLASAPPLPATVPPNTAITLDVRYEPMAVGSATGTLRIETNSPETPVVTVALSGTGVAVPVPQLVVSPPSVSFGEVGLGGSQALVVTISNAGNADLTVTGIQIESGELGAFRLGAVPMPPVLVMPGAALPVQVIFEPTVARSVTGTLQIMSDVDGTPLVTVPLSGTGGTQTVPLISVSPPAVGFGDVQVGTTRALEVTISNPGTAVLMIDRMAVDGLASAVFRLDNAPPPPVSIQPGSVLPVEIVYAPELTGLAMGTLEIESNASNTPLVIVGLNGNGVPEPMPQIAVSPPLVDFSEVQVGTTRALTVTVTNPGTAELTLTGVAVDGGPDGVFFLGTVPTIPVGVAPGDSVLLEAVFAPVTETSVAGTLTIESDVAGMPVVTVPLNGTGVPMPMSQIDVNPAALAFGDVEIGSTRLINVTITNLGAAPLNLSALTVNGPAFRLGAASGAPVVVEPASSVTAGIVFEPSSEDLATGTFEIGSDASNAPLVTVPLSGNGVAAPLPQLLVQPAILEFGGVAIGQFQTLTLSLSNPGNAALSLADIAIAEGNGAGFALSAALPLPIAIDPAASLDVDIRFEPVAPGTVTGTLQIDHNVAAIPEVLVPLSGTGVVSAVPQIVVEPVALDFGEVQLGESSQLSVTIRNGGTGDLRLDSVVLEALATSDLILSQAPTVPATVVPGGTATVAVEYLPTQEGEVAGTLRILSDAENAAEVTVLVRGTGVVTPAPQLAATPAALAFGDVQVNDTQVLTVTLSNPGTGDLEITELVLDAAVTSGFALSQVPTTPLLVVSGGAVAVDIAYTPSAEGPVTGTFRVLSNALNGAALPIPLSGTGVFLPMPQLVVAPAALDFAEVEVGQSGALTVTISNPGTGALEISAFTLDALEGAGFALNGVPPVPATVAAGETLEIGVTYTPAAEGTVTGAVRLLSNAVNTPEVVVPLQGTGVSVPVPQLSVQPAALSFGEVSLGSSVTLPLTLQNVGSAPLNIAPLILESEVSSGFALANVLVESVVVLPGE
jgi:hypothetical protein